MELRVDSDQEITEELIMKYIRKLKDNKAAGKDELGSSFKRLAGSLALPLMMQWKQGRYQSSGRKQMLQQFS